MLQIYRKSERGGVTNDLHRNRLIKEMVDELEALPDERLEEVRDFVDFVSRRVRQPKRGSPQALLNLFGCWEGPPGELSFLVDEIYQARDEED